MCAKGQGGRGVSLGKPSQHKVLLVRAPWPRPLRNTCAAALTLHAWVPGACTASMLVLMVLDGIRQAAPAISNAICWQLVQHRLQLRSLVIKGSSTSVPVLAQSDAQRLDGYSTACYK